jgi:hypothetical protein
MKLIELVDLLTKLILFKTEKGIHKFEWYCLGILFWIILFRIFYGIVS